MVKEVDPLTGIRVLSSYYKGLELFGNYIKNEMLITHKMTTTLWKITSIQKKKKQKKRN